MPQIGIVTNRAPYIAFPTKDSSHSQQPASGVVNAFDSLRMRKDVTWFAVPMSDTERGIARYGPVRGQGFEVRFTAVDPETYHYGYNEVYNGTIWPVCHGMTEWAARRVNTSRWVDLWQGYRNYNRQVAETVVAHLPDGSVVLVQDLYFVFLATELRRLGHLNLKSTLFLHLPFPDPSELSVLPTSVVAAMLGSITQFDAVGFLIQRWEQAFIRCCRALGIHAPRTYVAPVAPPLRRLRADRSAPGYDKELAHLEAVLGGRQMLTQLDRIDPAKNMHRSLQAYDILLEMRPEIRTKVIFVLLAQPSRQGLDDYRDYYRYVDQLCRTINEKHGSSSWQPVFFRDSFPHLLHVAALCRYDVLLVNSVRDGMNLVALEGPQLNERHGMSVVSPDAGAFEFQRQWVFRSHPWDPRNTAQAMYQALTVDAERRRHLFGGLRRASAEISTEDEFVNRQIKAALGE